LTVTFWPADVVIVKPADDTLPTVPAAPPGAGPDRALEPAPPAPPAKRELPAAAAEDEEDEDEDDEAQPAARPVTAHAIAAAMYAFGVMASMFGGA
jgi:hypothetical protein